ncbi:hypothetical protein HYZ64_01880 [Candidatus Berkelbacteria bacterium]|nr:hypothetical protein [Candidatus Berkelbacteria bacterium]
MANFSPRDFYLYAFSAVGVIFMLMGLLSLINFGIRVVLIPDYPVEHVCYETPDFQAHQLTRELSPLPVSKSSLRDCSEKELQLNNSRRREQRVIRFTGSLIILLIGLPLYLYHWRLARLG